MRRREFILVGGGAAVSVIFTSPLGAGKDYHMGFLSSGTGPAPGHEAFESSLASLGYQVGRNVVFERRHAAGDLGRLEILAGDLVRANESCRPYALARGYHPRHRSGPLG